MSGKPKHKPGERFGHITLIEDTGKRTNHSGAVIWKCRCDCGRVFERSWETIKVSLSCGHVISCGCKKSKAIGRREAFNPERIRKASEALGQIEGTTMQGIDRKSINKNNKSGVRGVCFKTREQKWQAEITLRGRSVGRKYFNTKEEAIAHRQELEREYFDPIKERYKEQKEKENG